MAGWELSAIFMGSCHCHHHFGRPTWMRHVLFIECFCSQKESSPAQLISVYLGFTNNVCIEIRRDDDYVMEVSLSIAMHF